MGIFTYILNSKLLRAVGAILMGILGVLAYGVAKKREGAVAASNELQFDDMKNALDIRNDTLEKYNEAKATVERMPIESVHDGLRSKGKLRD